MHFSEERSNIMCNADDLNKSVWKCLFWHKWGAWEQFTFGRERFNRHKCLRCGKEKQGSLVGWVNGDY